MMDILIDSNVLLDILTEDARWFDWSSGTLSRLANDHSLCINPIVYAETSMGFDRIEDLDYALPETAFSRRALPWEAAFLAGKCFALYRRRGGSKRSPLPDFFIGAHAAVEKMTLVTRDVKRYKTYFPNLAIVSPSNSPKGA